MNSFDVSLDHENRLVKITASGEFFQADGEKIITIARTTAAEHGYNALYDIRQATMTVNFASWYDIPRKLEVYKDLKTRRVKAALLVSPQDKAVEDYKFYEIVTDNVGLKLRVFFNEDEAFTWITGKPPSVE